MPRIAPPPGLLPDAPQVDPNAPPESRWEATKQSLLGMVGFGNPNSPSNANAKLLSSATPFAPLSAAGEGPGLASSLSNMVGTAAKPIARFFGFGDKATPLFKVEGPGHVLHDAIVPAPALAHHGIPAPPVPAAPTAAHGLMYDAEGIARPPEFFQAPGAGAPAMSTATAKTGFEPGIAKTYTPDLPSLLGGKGPGGGVLPPESVMSRTMKTAKAPGKVIKTPRQIADEARAKPVEPSTPESVARAKAARNTELEGVGKLKNDERAAGQRKGFRSVKGGKADDE